MNRIIIISIIPLLLFTACHMGKTPANKQKPNVILILTDDQGYGDIGAHGNPWLKTPHIDDFLATSVNLQNYHVDPTCSPTRAALMTGKYSARVGVWMTYMGRHHLNKDETTMADVFRSNGYKTAIFGKWHLGDNYPFRPTDRGFDESLVHGSGVIGETPDYWGNDYYDDTYFRNNQPEEFEGYCTDIWFEEAQKFVSGNKAQPFFLYLSLNAPHGPLNVPLKYVEPYLNNPDIPERRAWFYGMIASLDDKLGSFMSFLKSEELDKNTLIIFMTDNGTIDGFREKSQSGYNAGMRGVKGTPYEGGHRVACALRWPQGGFDTFRVITELSAHIDILPTLIDALGLKTEGEIDFDGTSLLPLLQNADTVWPGRTLCVHNQISFGEKLESDLPVKYKKYAVMTQQWRLVNGSELYDILDDPDQSEDIAKDFPEVMRQLHRDYEKWWKHISPQFSNYNSTIIDPARQQGVVLSCQFWHGNDVPYNQEHVRNGMLANGFWDIDVAKAGEYKIALRRWPRESGLALHDEVNKPLLDTTRIFTRFPLYELESNTLDIKSARLQVGDFDSELEVQQGQEEVVFRVNLEQGKQFIQTWFTLVGGDTTGAYYVYIELVEV